MLIVEILFNTDQTSSQQICLFCVCFMNVGLFVWLTSDQPEHILAELECEIQRDLFVLHDNIFLRDV